MLRFASSAMLTNSAPFSKDDVINGTLADLARRDEAGCLWTEADGSPECLRFYGSPAGNGESLPLVWLEGDVIDRGDRISGDIVVGDWYSEMTPLAKQLEFEMYAAALARPFIYLARPGCHGSSGDHAQRRREPNNGHLAVPPCQLQTWVAHRNRSSNCRSLAFNYGASARAMDLPPAAGWLDN
jgi:hypothetical protein